MLTPQTYGFGGRSSSAFYWIGLVQNNVKFPNSVTSVEAGFLSGLITQTGSNLPLPKVFVYSNPGSNAPATRFTAARFPNFVGMWGKSKAVFPTNFASWQVWGPPANAT